jgi:hypothetical protein
MSDKPASKAPVFAWMMPALTQVARTHGYAIGLHGSMARDLDLIAVPWTAEAAPAEVLAEAIRSAVDGKIDTLAHIAPGDDPTADAIRENPQAKPHGRLAWSIYFSGRMFYIDLSVMPRISALSQQ